LRRSTEASLSGFVLHRIERKSKSLKGGKMKNNRYLPEGYRIGTAENRSYVSSLAGLERAMTTDAICEAPAIMCDSENYDLRVDLGGVIGIIRREEVQLTGAGEELKNIAVITRVGRPVCFKVQYIDTSGRVPIAYLSRRAAQLECARCYISDLVRGDIIPAKVTHLERFGAFVDIGCGIVSLLPVDCISVSRISHPSERLSLSSRIYVVIKSIDPATGRICVTHRELLGTWEENAAMFAPGQTVAGIVRSVEDYGAFVELTPNLTGLAEPRDDIVCGQSAAVYIKSITPERMKIKLAIVGVYRGEILRDNTTPRYFINPAETHHIDYWRYSPPGCSKIIESVFT